MVVIAVPLNTIFGVGCALLLVRHKWKGNAVIDAIINLPFAISPVVIGLSLFLLYGTTAGSARPWRKQGSRSSSRCRGWSSPASSSRCPSWCARRCRCCRRSGPSRSRRPRPSGANGWQTFWRVTLPAIRWGVAYGVVLTTARVLGEFGAVTIVSGSISGETQTLPLFVEKQYDNFNQPAPTAPRSCWPLLALVTLLAMNLLKRKEDA